MLSETWKTKQVQQDPLVYLYEEYEVSYVLYLLVMRFAIVQEAMNVHINLYT